MDIVNAKPYAFAHIVPERLLTPGGVQAATDQAIDALVRAAVDAKIAGSADGLTIRPILPATDLDYTNEDWLSPSLTVNAWTQVVSEALNTPVAICFYGVFFWASQPETTFIRYRQGSGGSGSTRFVYGLQRLFGEDNPAGYHEPVVYTPGNTVYIDGYKRNATGTDRFGFFGFTAEPRGKIMDGRSL